MILRKLICLFMCLFYINSIFASTDCELRTNPNGDGYHYSSSNAPSNSGQGYYSPPPKRGEPFRYPDMSPEDRKRSQDNKRAKKDKIYSDSNYKFDKNSVLGEALLEDYYILEQTPYLWHCKGKVVELLNTGADRLAGSENYIAEQFILYAHEYMFDAGMSRNPRYTTYSENSKHIFHLPIISNSFKPEDLKFIQTANSLSDNPLVQTDPIYALHANLALSRLDHFRKENSFSLFNMELNNIWNIEGFSKGLVNSFVMRFSDNAYESAYAVSHPLESGESLYYAMTHVPELSMHVYNEFLRTWHEMPNYTYEQRGEVFGKLAADALSMYYGGAAGRLVNSATVLKHAAKAYEVRYHHEANKVGIYHHGPWNTNGGPLERVYLPLKDGGQVPVSSTFRSSSYIEYKTHFPKELYRSYDGTLGKELSRFWTDQKPTGPLQAQIDLALDPSWGNVPKKWSKIEVPAGETLFEGYVGPVKLNLNSYGEYTGVLHGTGEKQFYINRNIPDEWKKETGDL